MSVIHRIQGPERLIYLSEETVTQGVHPMDIYREMRALRRTDPELRKYDVFMKAFGNIPKGSGSFTERYVVLQNNAKIVPWDTSHALNVKGTIITSDGEEGALAFDRTVLSNGTQVDINYNTSMEILNCGNVNLISGTNPTELIRNAFKEEYINLEFGNLQIQNNQMKVWSRNGELITTYNLFDRNGNPTEGNIFLREVV